MGRPKKVVTAASEDCVPETTRRKRGRPPVTATESAEEPPKKKPGRPKKQTHVNRRKTTAKKTNKIEQPSFQGVFVQHPKNVKFQFEVDQPKLTKQSGRKKKLDDVPERTSRRSRKKSSSSDSEAEEEEQNEKEAEENSEESEEDELPVLVKKPTVKKVTKREYLTKTAKVVEEYPIKCGKCQAEMMKKFFSKHDLAEHNGLGWIEGNPMPDWENNEKALKKILFINIKKRRGSLICEICKDLKRSVLGWMSHVQFCGKNEEEKLALMYTCPLCHAVMMPSSMEYHDRTHRQANRGTAVESTNEDSFVELDVGQKKFKRSAAQRASSKWKEFAADEMPEKTKKLTNCISKSIIEKPSLKKKVPGIMKTHWGKALTAGNEVKCNQPNCRFVTNNLENIVDHYSQCNFTPRETFVCKICKFETKGEAEILDHTKANHTLDDLNVSEEKDGSDESVSDGSDGEVCEPKRSYANTSRKVVDSTIIRRFSFLIEMPEFRDNWSRPFTPGVRWTLEFERKNYGHNTFPEYLPKCFVRDSYYPQVRESMQIKTKASEDYVKYNLFEGGIVDGVPTFFTGGPVWAMAWLPIPTSMVFSDVCQFLAISCHASMESEYSVGRAYSGKNIIQLWETNLTEEITVPKLSYALTHKAGTVWCLEWCPSGCYRTDEAGKRIGLLAAGCSDGCVYVYSMISPADLPKNEGSSDSLHRFYHTNPVLTLVVNLKTMEDGLQNWQVTKIFWTKERDHDVLVAGFSNGYVALWNLCNDSSLLKVKKGDMTYLHPCKHFYAHGHAVNMVNLVPIGGKRFLATASFDRTYKFWDLEDLSQPRTCSTRSFVTDGTWSNNWNCAILAYDDALSLNHSYSYIHPAREYAYKSYSILPTNSPSYTVSFSDFGNCLAQGTLGGEVLVIFPQQLLYACNFHKAIPKKRLRSLFSTVVTNQLKESCNLSKEFIPLSYNDCKENIALTFRDNMENFELKTLLRESSTKKTLTFDSMNCPPVKQYPYMSVNRLCWNPNSWSFPWLAIGYHNGFVRLVNFKSMGNLFNISKVITSNGFSN